MVYIFVSRTLSHHHHYHDPGADSELIDGFFSALFVCFYVQGLEWERNGIRNRYAIGIEIGNRNRNA